jgi:dihydrofolate synthase / folylpolyglutamate synthase
VALPLAAATALDQLAPFGMRLGLERMVSLLAALDHPERHCPAVLVAGTNGKGTVSALLDSFARAARYRTGLYTSPHLESVEERIRVDGRAIAGEALGVHLTRVLAAAERTLDEPPTYFEALTACAWLEFAARKVELAIVEVGLGGRLDATNTVAPILSVVTSIGFDHTEHLGNELAAIAREKAGVFRPGTPVVSGVRAPEAADELRVSAARLGAPLIEAHEELRLEALQRHRPFSGRTGQRIWYRPSSGAGLEVFELPLPGRHQADNLAVAVVAARELRALGWDRLTPRALERGSAAVRWPGRLEEIVLPKGERVLLDGAHNAEGAVVLADHLATTGAPYRLLFGVLADKDGSAMLETLARNAQAVVLTTVAVPRARPAEELAPWVPAGRPVTVEPEPERALLRALEKIGQETVLVIAGSLYLVGQMRSALRRGWGVPPPATDLVSATPKKAS